MNEIRKLKETPLPFKTEMVLSVLDRKKNMTRRGNGLKEINKNPDQWAFIGVLVPNHKQKQKPVFRFEHKETRLILDIHCPYGEPGDTLWVRETWGLMPDGDVVFKAGATDIQRSFVPKYGRWKPGIHLFKKDARIWLEVTDVRPERLQEITEEDAKAEGIEHIDGPWYKNYEKPVYGSSNGFDSCDAITSFSSLWQSINGPESWDANPWVFVISFKHIKHGNVPIGSNAGPCVNPNIPVKRRD